MLRQILSGHEQNINNYLSGLYEKAPSIGINENSPFIIFSDLHMGNGKKNDDFRKNAALFTAALKEYYLKKEYTLVLNGDIEELQKFKMNSIRKAWQNTYDIFNKFDENNKLIKITGNHDDRILAGKADRRYNERKAVKIIPENSEIPIFIFHGHQASVYYRYLNRLNSILLRYIVNPIGIKNFSNKYKHQKKMRIENRSYNFSRKNGMISIIGHTHRPLFESLSRADSLHFEIETLLRRYRKAGTEKRRRIAARIRELKFKYDYCINSRPEYEPASLMYSTGIPVPCLFNTGCAIGKRGITGIEITSESISLVHWFDSRISSRFLFDSDLEAKPLAEHPEIHRVVLRKDDLSYIADTIRLLGGAAEAKFKNSFRSIKRTRAFKKKADLLPVSLSTLINAGLITSFRR